MAKHYGISFDQIMTDLRNKIYQPVYFLEGEETWYIDQISSFIQSNVLEESQKAFNLMVLYGRDTDMLTIINTARRFPMMANHLVVIIKEAQMIKNMEPLEHYITTPLRSTLLVFNYKYKTLDKRSRLYKMLAEKKYVFESPKLYEDKIPEWIAGYLKQKIVTISPEAALLLTEYLGSDLSKIANELDKLCIVLPSSGQRKIDTGSIEKFIGISKEYNNLELNKALMHKDVVKVYRIGAYLSDNQKISPFTVTISSLYTLFTRLLLFHSLQDKSSNISIGSALRVNPYFAGEYRNAARLYSPATLKKNIGLLREYDLKSKGVGNVSSSYGDLMKELLFKLMH